MPPTRLISSVSGKPTQGITIDQPTLEQTYGSEIVVLEGDAGPVRAVTIQHHDH